MGRPRETDSGKGDFNRSEPTVLASGYDVIDFGLPKIYFFEEDFPEVDEVGYYFLDAFEEWMGPFNTWSSAKTKLMEYYK